MRAHDRLMKLVETSLTMDQFNGAASKVLDGARSNLAVGENLEESRRTIRDRYEMAKHKPA
ncbi:MAG: hypothetical protein V1875_00895 [Candidatus Altiarchaeota archaeon]